MRELSIIGFLIYVSISFLSCQKAPQNPVEEKVTKVIDTSLIVGNWKLASKPTNYYALYFRQDHYIKQDNSGVWDTDLDGIWEMISEKTVSIGGVTATIKKLTADSLIIVVANTLFKHVRSPLPASDYVISAVARNLQFPMGITGDQHGTVYFNEETRERISKVTGLNNIITVIAGGYIGRNNSIALEKDGSLITCDGDYHQVKRISFANQSITIIAGKRSGSKMENVLATEADIDHPVAVAVDDEENIYVAERSRIRKINKATGLINTIVGKVLTGNTVPIFNANPGTGLNTYVYPSNIATDIIGNLYITDVIYGCVWKYAKNGDIKLVAGNGTTGFSGDGNISTSAQLNVPCGVAVDAAGNIYISDTGNHRIRKVNVGDGKISTIAGRGQKGIDNWANPLKAKLADPTSIYVDEKGSVFFIDSNNSELRKLTLK